jgi:hypothetical protein
MPSAGFEPATPATKRPQTYALDRAATEVCSNTSRKQEMYTTIWIEKSKGKTDYNLTLGWKNNIKVTQV